MRIGISRLRSMVSELLSLLEQLGPVDIPWDAYWDFPSRARYDDRSGDAPVAHRRWLSRDLDDIKDVPPNELAVVHLVQISNLLRALGDHYASGTYGNDITDYNRK